MPDSFDNPLARQCSILSVEAGTSWQDVRLNYQRLVQEWHPDRNAGPDREAAQERFIVINSAFKDLKQYYDRHGALPKLTNESVDECPIFVKRQRDRLLPHIKFRLKAGTALFFGLIACLVALWRLDAQLVEQNRDSARSIQSMLLKHKPGKANPATYQKANLPSRAE